MPGDGKSLPASPQAVLFDVDGTLIDTVSLIVMTMGEMFRRFLNVKVSAEEIKAIIGRPLEVQVRLFDHRSDAVPDHDAMIRFQIDQYEQNRRMERLIPEAIEAVRVCGRKGVRTGLVTSKDATEMRYVLPRLGLDGSLDTVISATDSPRPKPHPDPVRVAVERLGVDPGETLFVGDADYDIQAGRGAGTRVAGVLWGAQTEERLTAARPDHLFRTPRDLLDWCERI